MIPKLNRKVNKNSNKDDNIHKQRSSKKSDLYLKQGPRKSRFPLNLTDRHTDGRTLVSIEQLYLNQGPRKSRFHLNLTDMRKDGHQYLQSSFASNKDAGAHIHCRYILVHKWLCTFCTHTHTHINTYIHKILWEWLKNDGF